VLAGNGRIAEIRSKVAAAGLSGCVVVNDWLGQSERDAALSTSDVYVLPSLNEGLPMGMLEAMSWGLAVVTTPVGGIPEVVIDGLNGLLVPPKDEDALTAAMTRLIEDASLRERLALAARSTAQRFDISRYWSSLRPLLQSAAGQGPARE
jgi:glycosyltransferase involved in cell wall biosynthesis